MQFPRHVHRYDADPNARSKEVANKDAFDQALKDGWSEHPVGSQWNGGTPGAPPEDAKKKHDK